MGVKANQRPVWLAVLFLILVGLACNAPGPASPTGMPSVPAPTVPQAGKASPTPFPAQIATDTLAPDVFGPGGCVLNAAFVADVTVPDGSEFAPGAAFTKVWRVRNSGTCVWEAGSQLLFASGELMHGPAAVNVPSVAPGSGTDVSVNLVAPDEPGTYRSVWQMQSPEGVRFGGQVYVQIVVLGEATEEPTAESTTEPTGEATEEPTEESALPDLVITGLEVDADDPHQGMPLHIVATLHNQGEAVAQNVHWAWRVCVHSGCNYVEAPGTFTLWPDEEIIARMEYQFDGWADYTTEAWVDSRGEVEESDEDNNTYQLSIPVKPGLPDLTISALTFDPDPPVQGQNAVVAVIVRNQGAKPSATFTVEWWASVGAPVPACEWAVVGGLEEGKTTVLECTYAYPSWHSSITTRAVADVGDDVTEWDENNNVLDKSTPVHTP
jgi:hypothetical protein